MENKLIFAKEIIKEAQQKAQEIIHSANKTIEQTIRDIRENQAEKEKTKEIRQKMEAEKERLLSEQASAEEERIRKKMEKLQNREKNIVALKRCGCQRRSTGLKPASP